MSISVDIAYRHEVNLVSRGRWPITGNTTVDEVAQRALCSVRYFFDGSKPISFGRFLVAGATGILLQKTLKVKVRTGWAEILFGHWLRSDHECRLTKKASRSSQLQSCLKSFLKHTPLGTWDIGGGWCLTLNHIQRWVTCISCWQDPDYRDECETDIAGECNVFICFESSAFGVLQ